MRRRQLLGTTGIALTASTAGCLGFLTGQQPLSFAADPAVAADSTASEAGYETEGPKEKVITREYTAAGQTREVEVTNQITTYEKTIEMPLFGEARLGVFAAVSSPKVKIAGQTLNPLKDYTNRQLVGLLASEYESIENPTEVGERTVETLGSELTFTKYEATATVQGQDVDVFIHVGRIESGEDFVVPLGVYPKEKESQEQPNIISLTESLEHPA